MKEHRKGRLVSPGSMALSSIWGGSQAAEKQCGCGDTRVFWLAVLTRGKLGIHVFTELDDFPGDAPGGA